MLISKTSNAVPFKITLLLDAELVKRLEAVRQAAADAGLTINLEAEIARVLAGQVTRAERLLSKA